MRPRVTITENGPYLVEGDVAIGWRIPVETEHDEPIAWHAGPTIEHDESYALCRCGGSAHKPFCDGTHRRNGFDGTETANRGPREARARPTSGPGIAVQYDRSLCEHAGFCGNRVTNVWEMVGAAADTQVRAEVVAMVERCPSGALTYSLDQVGVIEPELPVRIGVVPDGPISVTGGLLVEAADGETYEVRNRVTLCRCGQSANKPFCDGTHKEIGFAHRPDG